MSNFVTIQRNLQPFLQFQQRTVSRETALEQSDEKEDEAV